MRFFERLLLPVTLGLIACGSELSQVDHESSLPTAKEIETAVKQVEIQSESNPNNFTTEGKPTKTIETPWGPREVYDSAHDPDIIRFFDEFRTSANTFNVEEFYSPSRHFSRSLSRAQGASKLDLARIGCVEIINYACQRVRIKIEPVCDFSTTLGQSSSSPCEVRNFYHVNGMGSFGELVNSDVRRDECERAGKPHTSMAYKGDILIDLPRDEFLASITDLVCNVWRGEEDWTWFKSLH